MRHGRLVFLAQKDFEETRARMVQAANSNPAAKPQKNRKERRVLDVLNRRLAARLTKDGTKATLKVLPDGGIDVKVDTREEEDNKE